ncbi:MAG TPA: DNA topoisomerase (ATP-hydrolyzing) subunit B [Oscillibacter sp.]|jgi:DNA gyrase subunit B|nr:DNA topoisomerase (ATP-hydrolyzing) subunit B [Clostridiales bacterium]HCX44642.1 DNA topoisomerase (ATP-hydrolyzing) subunit B [Oscillibacter sp.]
MSELEKVIAVDTEYDASEIQVLEGLEAVRKRPGMYIGSTSSSGLHHLVYEIVDNAIDEALAGYCTDITVTINEGDTITVTDNGRGIPVDIQPQTGRPALEVVYTVLHAGGKFGGGGYKVSGGLHGVGASVVNALSEWLEVQVYKNGHIYEMKFSRGDITQEMKIIGDTDRTGTTVTFKPDPEVFDTLVYDYDILHTRMREQAFLNAGLRITITDARPGSEQGETMCYEGGIREYVTYLNRNKTPLHQEVIYLSGAKGDSTAEIALQYNDGYNETLVSFANDIHTPGGGMHETGFKAALTRVLNAYGTKYGMLKDGDDKVSGEDCREGIAAVISVKLTEAQFEGQTKDKLGNAYIRTLVDGIVSDQLAVYMEEHPAVARTILDKALTANRAREAARKARESIRRKTALGGAAMPDKLRDCNENNPELTELYIVEGDSAGGSATQGRDSRFQAILPLWGKMLNVEKARADKVYGNDKLQPVITALGAGIGDEFDADKLRYHKIIIMADADVDGAHIRTLLLTFFFRFMRPLIENGYVYSAVPPLYKLSRGKQTRVAYSDEERDAVSALLRGDNPDAKVDISRFKGLGEMNPHELWETTMDPEKRTLRRITLDDAVAADATFTVLMGEKVEPRKEFIEQKAKYAVNLDY